MKFKNNYMSLVWLFSACTFTFSVIINDGHDYGSGLVVLMSLGLFFLKPDFKLIDKEDCLFIFSFLVYAFSMYFAVFMDIGGEIRDIDKPTRFIFALFALLLLLTISNRKEWLWYGAISCSFLSFLVAAYQRFFIGLSRAEGETNPIMFGNINMLMGFICLISSIYFFSQRKPFSLILSLIGAVSGISASLLSGSRGGWVALPLIMIFLFWQCKDLLSNRVLKISVSSFILVLCVIIAIPQTGVQNRIGKAVYNVSEYIQGNSKTSVGLRFEMWEAAIHMFQDSPIFGVGASQSEAFKDELAENGIIHPAAVPYITAHNDMLEALSKRGLIGLAFLIMIYIIPLHLFLKKLRLYKENWRVRSYALAGALIPMCYFDFGLTVAMINYKEGVMVYAFSLVYFWAAVRWSEREEQIVGMKEERP
ncbi:polymerase [Marinomonas ushuaiensis DSM 15871]|uniref:Polymerase n=1 Tax=Marinomonas ushuaiensis DSM 15871 TaxID=1122207 RepID=X7EBU4_9GAMM|nr:O-antigen ligase family protein [Marinomonas ushuaiensis]ETX12593.1 polymerase [Marinomonas ushuaiensis DSM 15871]